MIIGEDKVIDLDTNRAAIERADGKIALYEIVEIAENERFGKAIAIVEGPMIRGETYVKTGMVPPDTQGILL